MEEKTTEEIIQDNSELAEKILNQEPNVETYTGEFKETYNKKWVALDEVNSKLSQIKKELKEKIKKKVLFPLCSYKSYFDFIKNCGDLIDETDDLITQIINKGR